MKRMIKALLVALLLLIPWSQAGATVIDFESLDPSGGTMGALYQEDGYTLTNDADAVFNNDSVTNASFGWWNVNYQYYAGSLGLFTSYWPLTVTLTKDDNGLFDMYSIDLSRLGLGSGWDSPGLRSVIFVGTKADGSTVTQVFTYSDEIAFQTFYFRSDFTGLISLSWAAASQELVDGIGVQYYQFDNIVMYSSDTADAVPEPATMLLFGIGLAGVAAVGRKFRK